MLFSCNYHRTHDTANEMDSSIVKNPDTNLIQDKYQIQSSDSVITFNVDDYPVTDKMFMKLSKNNDSLKMKSGPVFSLDKVWFTNDTLHQTLVFELYTDNFRLEIYHFDNSDIPEGIIKHMELDISKSKYDNVFELASYEQKKDYLNGFIRQSEKINQKYFITDKGFKLNDLKDKAIKIYGKPDHTKIDNGIEVCEWDFYGDYVLSDDYTDTKKIDLHGKPLAKNSFGNQVIMYFRNNKLIGIILHNDIP